MPCGTYLADKYLGLFKNTAINPAAGYYIALFTVMPTAPAGTGGTECAVAGNYSRPQMPFASWGAQADDTVNGGRMMKNSVALAFPTANADWMAGALIVGFGIYDASSAGNYHGSYLLKTPRQVLNGQTPTFDVGDLQLTER